MRNWISLVENAIHAKPQTLWVNGRTGEIIDVEEEGSAHHMEFAIDNPERLGIRPSSRALAKARDMDYEDMVGDTGVRQEAFRRHWVRCNYENGWLSAEAASESDVFDSCQTLREKGYQIITLIMEMGRRYHTLKGEELKGFLG